MFPAKLETNGPLKVGYALQYQIETEPKAYFYGNKDNIFNIELIQPDGTIKKELVNIVENCSQYFLTPVCTPQASYERTFSTYYYDSNGSNIFEKAGTYTLSSDSPEITPVTFEVTGNNNSVSPTSSPVINSPQVITLPKNNFLNASITDLNNSAKFNFPVIIVLSPNGGEVWKTGSTYKIEWISKNSYLGNSNKVRILFTDGDHGGAITTIATVDSPDNVTNTYNWTIPQTMSPSTGDTIRVEYTGITECPGKVPCTNDGSDAPFSVVAG